ncbi:MAG: nucleotide exchange factor GrpE [Firmicutes bacterium]|nr:nucleotide exchange factor GrpE [Bacillota bacterium]
MSMENNNKQYEEREQAAGEPEVEMPGNGPPGELNPTEETPVGDRQEDDGGPEEVVEAEPVAEEAGDMPATGQVQKELDEQKARAEDYYNRLLRLQADFDNYRRRTTREREDFARYASASLCESLLPVLDNFQLALVAKEQDPAKVVEGVEMIYRQLLEVLHKEGLTPVEAEGEQFDPTKHEAAMQEITGDHPDNTVLSELRRGYYLKDKLLRPAMVKVAKAE